MHYRVKVIPDSKRNQVVEIKPGVLSVTLKAKPLHNEANVVLIKVLADYLHVQPSTIHILTGHHGRNKLIEIR